MKNIKYFKYKNTYEYNCFLKDYGYKLSDVKGFSVSSIKQYHNNILKTYKVYFNDGEEIPFKVVYFNSLNEYHQSALGFSGNKLLEWYQNANIVWYKLKDIYGLHDKYVITTK